MKQTVIYLLAILFLASCFKPKEPANCHDGKKNQSEDGIDCGFPCDPCPTCSDFIKNQGEENVDCGGPCTACPSCNDGIQNQDEEGIDCGGDCKVCETCMDGLMNQNETGIDCGDVCEPCTTNECNTNLGYTEGTYFPGGPHVIGATGGIYPDSILYVVLGHISLGAEYTFTFEGSSFFSMPINSSRFAVIGDNFDTDDYPYRFCTASFNLGGQLKYVEEDQKIYFTRISEKQYNIKFCSLKVYTSNNTINYFSVNANFILN
ncbi:MAG: hypothetical protein JNL60_08810 [Bacteroidia bacterium]|nr:hypothetical protein [Bacteroidia bacterium]